MTQVTAHGLRRFKTIYVVTSRTNDEVVRIPFRDRAQAGRAIAAQLRIYANRGDVIVAALPRGGVPVAAEIARSLNAPLTVFLVRKLGVPGHEELAMGSITTGGMRFLDENLLRSLHISDALVESIAVRETQELLRREQLYSRRMPTLEFRNKTVILVDDGVATGASMRLCVDAIRKLEAREVIVAVPVGSREAISALRRAADAVVCLAEPARFSSVGEWYEDFRQISDWEVCKILDCFLESAVKVESA